MDVSHRQWFHFGRFESNDEAFNEKIVNSISRVVFSD